MNFHAVIPSEVEESRGAIQEPIPRDPSTPLLRSTQDDGQWQAQARTY